MCFNRGKYRGFQGGLRFLQDLANELGLAHSSLGRVPPRLSAQRTEIPISTVE